MILYKPLSNNVIPISTFPKLKSLAPKFIRKPNLIFIRVRYVIICRNSLLPILDKALNSNNIQSFTTISATYARFMIFPLCSISIPTWRSTFNPRDNSSISITCS